MPCELLPFGDGGYAIVCSRGPRRPVQPCHYCGKPHEVLCDWPLPNGKTCDRRCCREHATRIDAKRDYCQDHQREAERQKALEF